MDNPEVIQLRQWAFEAAMRLYETPSPVWPKKPKLPSKKMIEVLSDTYSIFTYIATGTLTERLQRVVETLASLDTTSQ